MARTLLFSDVHIHPHKRKNSRIDDCLKCVEWAFETAKKRNIQDIVFGGDLFHDRSKIDVYTYHRTFELLQKHLDGYFRFWVLLGNHDLWFNQDTTVNSVKPFSALPGVNIIDAPMRLPIAGANWDFIPFTHDPIKAIKELKALEGDAKIAVGHIALDGAILHGTHHSDVMIEHDGEMTVVDEQIFADYEHVFLGHYHIAQHVNDRIEYMGSPLQLSFGEAYQDKHLIVFDPETGEKEYIKNTFSPKHYVIKPEERDKQDMKGCFVKVMVDDITAADIVEIRNDMSKANLASFEIKQKKQKIEEHVVEDAKAILFKEEEMLDRYMDEVGVSGLDKDKLLEVGQRICQSNN